MGHGTEAKSNKVYATMQEKLKAAGYNDYFVGTVEATPSVDDVIAQVKESGKYKRVILQPLMVVAAITQTTIWLVMRKIAGHQSSRQQALKLSQF